MKLPAMLTVCLAAIAVAVAVASVSEAATASEYTTYYEGTLMIMHASFRGNQSQNEYVLLSNDIDLQPHFMLIIPDDIAATLDNSLSGQDTRVGSDLPPSEISSGLAILEVVELTPLGTVSHGSYLPIPGDDTTKASPIIGSHHPAAIKGSISDVGLDDEDFIQTNQPGIQRVIADMSTLFIIVKLCDQDPAVTVEDFTASVMDSTGGLPGYVQTCSYGKARLDLNNSKVVTLELPCNGVRVPYRSDSCRPENLLGWMWEAEYMVETNLEIQHRRYRHHVIVLPKKMPQWAGIDCSWSGMAVVGMQMATWSYAWVNGDDWMNKMVYLHEISHNRGLLHAATGRPDGNISCSHCDWSSTMGYCCVNRCFNPVHNYQLGWARPISVLDRDTFQPGSTEIFEVPSQLTTDLNYIQIRIDWLDSPNRTIFVGYRKRTDPFDQVTSSFCGVNVYMYWAFSQIDLKDSIHMGQLSANRQFWTEPGGEVVIRLLATMGDTVTVSVCRPDLEQSAEACRDGIDNDCDGFTDADDAGCSLVLASSSTTSPPPNPSPLLPPPTPPSPSPPPPTPPPSPILPSSRPPPGPPPPSPPPGPPPPAPRPSPTPPHPPPQPPANCSASGGCTSNGTANGSGVQAEGTDPTRRAVGVTEKGAATSAHGGPLSRLAITAMIIQLTIQLAWGMI